MYAYVSMYPVRFHYTNNTILERHHAALTPHSAVSESVECIDGRKACYYSSGCKVKKHRCIPIAPYSSGAAWFLHCAFPTYVVAKPMLSSP